MSRFVDVMLNSGKFWIRKPWSLWGLGIPSEIQSSNNICVQEWFKSQRHYFGAMEQILQISLLSSGFVLLAMGHGYVTRSHIRAGINGFNLLTGKVVSGDQLRFNEALLQARLQMVKKVAATMLHFIFLVCLTALWKLIHKPCLSSLFEVGSSICCYTLHIFAHSMVQTEYHFRAFEAITILAHVLFSLGIANERDLVMFDAAERVSQIGSFCASIMLIDVKVTLPLHAFQSTMLTYCRWKLIGFEQLTFYVMSLHVISNIIIGGVLAICIHHIQSLILAQLDSGDASSLVSGFRQVLRGVCDGDVVLNRSTMTIVDDASCLERVLKSNRNSVLRTSFKYTSTYFHLIFFLLFLLYSHVLFKNIIMIQLAPDSFQ